MQVAARARLFLARRPWVYWLVVMLLAGAVAVGVDERLAAVDDARRRWATVRPVAVAVHDHRPGDPLATRVVELPEVAIPPGALDEAPTGARARQRITDGEVVVDVDVVPPDGPAAGAPPGTLVVPVADPLARDVRIGQELRIAADGIVLAADAIAVDVVDDIVFVAVAPADAPRVAAAAKAGDASLLYEP